MRFLLWYWELTKELFRGPASKSENYKQDITRLGQTILWYIITISIFTCPVLILRLIVYIATGR